MMSDLGSVVKPVLIIDAKATEHILHRHGIGKNEHTDVAHLWLQDEIKSNRLRIRRVKSEANLVDIGTKAISNKITRKHAISMVYVDAQENLKTGGVMALWIEESERPDQSSSAQQKTSLESTGRHARQRQQQRQRGQPSLAEVTKRDDSKPGATPFLWSVSTQADCHGQLQSFTHRFLDELVRGQHEVLGR